ncbi:unnamed protein product [Adineta ricciae]|uniref:Uncharacterized protein n=1 Tax=Adineta ricciae TaxID=249248 RepID=A0A813Z2V8_ADIRI|nr:unnamed protein product [Adineta ricciae]
MTHGEKSFWRISNIIMSEKIKKRRNVCRLTVVKIVDSGPIPSNHADSDDEQISSRDHITRQSPQQKRPISPTPTLNIAHKKLRLEQTTNSVQKKPVQSLTKSENSSKTTANTKKPKLALCKASSITEEKVSKSSSVKESNQSSIVNDKSKNSSLSKPPSSMKLVKSHSMNDVKSSSQSIPNSTKKKELVVFSPPKSKPISNSQPAVKKSITKNPPKTSIKTEQLSTSIVKSPSTIVLKQETASQSSTNNIPSSNAKPSTSLNTLKKIPKKPVSSSTPSAEKQSRLSMPTSSLKPTSTRELQRQTSLSSKPKSSIKREHSLPTISTVSSKKQSEKSKIVKDSKLSCSKQSNLPPSSLHSHSLVSTEPSVVFSTPPAIDTSQSSTVKSPSVQVFPTEDPLLPSSMDIDTQLSDKSSPHEQTLTKATVNQMYYSDQSEDPNDSESSEEENEDEDEDEEDLPSSLTNDDLRYKLIYIYNRFQLNSMNDLIIFVRFFKRHQLIDISTLSMTKKSDEMFTYDLFSLSPSHIGELANDLGYTN